MDEKYRVFFSCAMATSFTQAIFRGVARFADRNGISWQLRIGDEVRERDSVRDDGVITFSTGPNQIRLLQERAIPTVCTSTRNLDSGFPCVITDNELIGKMAAEHFRERHHRSFGYVGPADLLLSRQRGQAFAAAVAPEPCPMLWLNEDIGYEGTNQSLLAFLISLPKPTAVFTASDVFARRVCSVLVEAGMKVPEDYAVLGVDADEVIGYSSLVRLASVDSNPEQIGMRAAEMLQEMMEARSRGERRMPYGREHVEKIAPRRVVTGASTDALASTDELVQRAMTLIRQRAHTGMNVEELAGLCAVSRRTLEYHFAAATGGTALDQIRRIRLERAKELLSTTTMPIYLVAEKSGFVSPYHFSHAFRKTTGLTPGAFRTGNAR